MSDWATKFAGRLVLVLLAILATAAWLGLTLFASRPAVRALFDVTPEARYTFTPETDALLDEIAAEDKVVRIDTFFEPTPVATNELERHVYGLQRRIFNLTSDLLRIYDERGGDAVQVKSYDRRSDVEGARARIQELDLKQRNVIVVSLGSRSDDSRRARSKVLSVHWNPCDVAQVDIPARDRPQMPGASAQYPTLDVYKGEEAISTAIRSLRVEGTPTVYFLQGYGESSIRDGAAASYYALAQRLRNTGFEVRDLPLRQTGRIPDDATILALMEPTREIPERDAELIMEFIRRGGRMFLNASFSPIEGRNPSLRNLGSVLGFELGNDMVAHLVADPSNPTARGRGGVQAQHIVAELHPNHSVTRLLHASRWAPTVTGLREVKLPTERPEGVFADPSLVMTGPWSWIPRTRRDAGTIDPDLSAWPRSDGAYAKRSVAILFDVDPTEGSRKGQVVLFTATAFLNQMFEQNGLLAMNIFNYLAERRELVTAAGSRFRTSRIALVEAQSERIGALLIYGVPGGLLLLSFAVFWFRRRL